ncbi:MAG: TetR/AcrR family transcriptional regulator, partial [Microbacterium sp.]
MNRGIGRPRASSRETLAEAATELFLERGFEATSIADIATRAGVSRSSFFNYFDSKSDVLWAGLDERLGGFDALLAADEDTDAASAVRCGVLGLAEGFAPDSLALGIVHAKAMGIIDELEREAALRRSRVAHAVSARLVRGGEDRLRADVAGAAWGGAVL